MAWLAGGVSIAGLSKFVGGGLFMFTQIALARLLGPAGFGLYSIGWTIQRIVGTIVPLGLGNGVVHYGARYWGNDALKLRATIRQSLGIALLSGILVGLALYLAAPALAIIVFRNRELIPIFRTFAPILVLIAGLRVSSSANRISLRMDYSVLPESIFQPATNLLLIMALCWLGYGVLAAVRATATSYAAAFLAAAGFQRLLFGPVLTGNLKTTVTAKQLLNFSLPSATAAFVTVTIFWMDRLVVAHFMSSAHVGAYQAASQTAVVLDIILGTFNYVVASRISQLYHRSEIRRLEELFRVSTKWTLYCTIPLFLTFGVAPARVLTGLYGNRYAEASLPLLILSIGQMVTVGTGAVMEILIFTGRPKTVLLLSSLVLTPGLALSCMLTAKYGLNGAAIATACSGASIYLAALYVVKWKVGIFPVDARWLKGLLSATATLILLLVIHPYTVDPAWLGLTLTIGMATTVFLVGLVLLGLDVEDYEILRLITAFSGPGDSAI